MIFQAKTQAKIILLNWVPGGREHRQEVSLVLGDVAEPAEQPPHPVEVVPLRLVGDAVVVHDLDAAELRVRGVDLPAQELVERAGSRQDDGGVLNLEVWEPLF